MSDKNPDNHREVPPDPQRIVIEFKEHGAADFMPIVSEGVTAAQLFAVAGWLDWKARNLFSVSEALKMQAAAQAHGGNGQDKIAVPQLIVPRDALKKTN